MLECFFSGSNSPSHPTPTSPGGIGLLDSSDPPLLPSSFGLANAAACPVNGVKEEDGEGGGVVKANKGMILRKSVDYIRSVFSLFLRHFFFQLFSFFFFFQISPTTSNCPRRT